MIPVIVSGACGRMGKAILSSVFVTEGFSVAGALEAPGHPDLERTVADACGIAGCLIPITTPAEYKGEKAVLIEFTSPEATMFNLDWALKRGFPMVIGTTALSAEQEERIEAASKEIPVVYASNMSVGVNLLFKLVEDAAVILGSDYDIEIFEVHHRFKKDAPSGTARTLAERAAAARGLDPSRDIVYGRKGIVGERKSEEIGVHALRTGDVVGEHTVVFGTLGERVELTHRCHSRATFALGALRAARFVMEKKQGFFSMRDVLGIV